MITSNNWH